jgi:serine/threonine-protein kinase
VTDLTHLGKYEIKSALGKGAMGIVYKGYDPHIERYVAIKTIRKDLVDPKVAQQYMAALQERGARGRPAHASQHRGGVRVRRGRGGHVHRDGVRRGRGGCASTSIAARRSTSRSSCGSCASSSRRSSSHTRAASCTATSSPRNLIVSEDGKLKVADFGIARVDTTNLTQAGMIIGTPSYMSPEQCRGLDSDARSDLWSAGVVMYELLTGEKPFRGTMRRSPTRSATRSRRRRRRCPSCSFPADVDRWSRPRSPRRPRRDSRRPRISARALDDVAKLSVEVDEGLGTTVVSIGTLMLAKPGALLGRRDAAHGGDRACARAGARWRG